MTQPLAAPEINITSASDRASVFIIAVIPKGEITNFPLYWLLLKDRPQGEEEGLPVYLKQALNEILVDPLLEELHCIRYGDVSSWYQTWRQLGFVEWAEKQFFPGVTDNLSHIVQEALALKQVNIALSVASGRAYLARQRGAFNQAAYKLYHPLIEKFVVHDLTKNDSSTDTNKKFLSFPFLSLIDPPATAEINLAIGDEELQVLSRDRLLALNLTEMQAVRDHFQQESVCQTRLAAGMSSRLTDVELEIIAQTWSEHCKHKIFNASITYSTISGEGDTSRTHVKSLYKTYIQGATSRLQDKRKDLLSVFKDNSGVVQWDDNWAVCFKVETHNSPSALEPYGGGLTGILGVNRDILGTGLGAKPIFNTDILCFAYPSDDLPKRPKLLPAQTILDGVRKAIQDGGNKSGIPTVNGAIVFEPGYRAKPLVFCGTGGLLPLKVGNKSALVKHTKPGDTIVMAGGRVGKDGIHGATFSSEALHEGSPVTAVQFGDPFTQKRLSDFIIEARDLGLITGLTDNGAGGLSSSVGEMAEITNGATIELDRVPTKYPGLADWEIVVSESQERMTISTDQYSLLQELAGKHNVEISAIGVFNTSGKFEVTRHGKLAASLDLNFLHGGVPPLELEAEAKPFSIASKVGESPQDLGAILIKLLGHPNICSRETIIRQYDHEVQGRSVIKPLMGEKQTAPCDAAVIIPVLGTKSGLAIANGICPRLSTIDAHLMAICAVDEAIRNLVCVGADPNSIALLDNFCWPDPVASATNPSGKHYLAQLVECCQGLFEAATKFEAPLISGKDSMKNDFDDGVIRLSIPPTLLISAIAKIPDAEQALSMEFKKPGDLIYLLSAGTLGLAGSHYEGVMNWQSDLVCSLDLLGAKALYEKIHGAITRGWINSAHDLSEGGLGVSLAECAIGSGLGASITLLHSLSTRQDILLFGEAPGRLLITIDPRHKREFEDYFNDCACSLIGSVSEDASLTVTDHPDTRILSKENDPSKILLRLSVEAMKKLGKRLYLSPNHTRG